MWNEFILRPAGQIGIIVFLATNMNRMSTSAVTLWWILLPLYFGAEAYAPYGELVV
jgi:hypothetical protein